MKLRIALGAAALGVLAAFTSSAAQAEPTEETQAAYVLAGLLDNAMAMTLWVEQTATSPATFAVHDGKDAVIMTMTVSKLGNCEYQLGVELTGQQHGHVDSVKNLLNADPDKVMPGNRGISVPGMTGSCKVVSGDQQLCTQERGDTLGFIFETSALAHERAALKAFKAKYCK